MFEFPPQPAGMWLKMNYLRDIQTFIEGNTVLSATFSLLLLLVAGMVTHLICKFFVVKVVRRVFFSTHKKPGAAG